MSQENRIIAIAALIQLVNIIDFMMVMPLGPDIAANLPISNTDIGLICSCYTLAVAFSGVLCVKFLDAFDRKHVAVITVLGLSIGTLSAVFADNLSGLIAARIIAGLFGGPAAAISLALISDAVPAQRRGRAMAVVMGTFSVSAIFAIPLSIELARIGSWKTPFYGIFLLGCIVVVLIYCFTPSMTGHLQHRKAAVSFGRLLSNRNYFYAFIMMMTAMISTYAIIPPLSAYLQLNLGYPRDSLGALYLVGGFFSLVLIQIGGRSSDAFGPLPTNLVGTLFYVVFLCDGFLHRPFAPIMLVFVMFMGTSCFRNVSATTEASKLPPPHERAAFMSLLTAVQHFGNGIGALAASAILSTDKTGVLVHMEWVGLLAIAMAFFQPLLLVMIRKNEEKTDSGKTGSTKTATC